MRAMARNGDGRTALIEIKAVDGIYPLYGTLALDPEQPRSGLLAQKGDAYGAAADAALLARLNLKPGDRVTIGGAAIALRLRFRPRRATT